MESRLPAGLPGTDAIGDAYQAGIAAGHGGRRPARGAIAAGKTLHHLLTSIGAYPDCEELQVAAAQLLERDAPDAAVAAWRGVAARFPHSHDAFCGLLAATARQDGADAAHTLIGERYKDRPDALPLLIPPDRTDGGAFRLFPEQDEAWRDLAARISASARRPTAGELLDRAVAIGSAPVRDLLRRGLARRSSRIAHIQNVKTARAIGALGTLFDAIVARRNADPPRETGDGPVTMLTGSLGAGGGERQFVRTAQGLHTLTGPAKRINVLVRSLNSRSDGGFFGGELERAGIGVRIFGDLPDFGGDIATSAVRPALDVLGMLPGRMVRNVIKLTDELRRTSPDAVHIWQDGMIYHGGLAALLAGVPRIVLNARSVPPIDRPNRYRPEYDVIYRSLLTAANVVLSVNSRQAARRFSEWLGIDLSAIAVIPNGVAALPAEGDDEATTQYRRFDAATGPSELTLGTVMRMDDNKRPFLWVDAAACILRTEPRARFIMVGGGDLREQTMRRAARLGIAGRFLFVGLSSCVGFWLSKMDAFLLTSRYEGLPNALIEAQLAGVPVITTPADGALEATIPGVSALVTGADPTPEEIAARILILMRNPDLRRRMGAIGARWAADRFSVAAMIRRSAELLGVEPGGRSAERGHDLAREPAQRVERRARIDQQDQRHAASL